MSNSPLVNLVNYSPNHSGRRTHPITKIAIHHTAGAVSAATIGHIFKPRPRQASCNYGIGNDNKVILVVDEKNRSWCTSSAWCDNRAITIEVANSRNGGNWPVSDRVLATLIDLVTDICRRNGIKDCIYTGGKDGVLQKHEWYSNTDCPGPYLGSLFPYISREVNKRLRGNTQAPNSIKSNQLYRVRKTWQDAKSQKGAFRNLNNAKACANKYIGYRVFDGSGRQVYPVEKIKKSIDAIVREVINGKWSNGDERKRRLRQAGYDYNTVQEKVNEIISVGKKSVDTIAREVINGKWGNGLERKRRLTQAGCNYNQIQKRVNELL